MVKNLLFQVNCFIYSCLHGNIFPKKEQKKGRFGIAVALFAVCFEVFF